MQRKTVKSSSLYDYYFNIESSPAVLVIRDMDITDTDPALRAGGQYLSVTNNMAGVVREIEIAEDKPLAGTPIIYRDSLQHYDGLACGDTVHAYYLGIGLTSDETAALQAVRSPSNVWARKGAE